MRILLSVGAVAGTLVSVATASAASQSPSRDAVQPFVTPQRDVDVTYVMLPGDVPAGSNAAATQRLRWSVALQSQRIDVPGASTYMVTDHRRHVTAAVRLDGHGVVKQAATDMTTAPGAPASGGYIALGGPTQTIAGHTCREWSVRDAQGQDSIVCLTDDGVLLRARLGSRVLLLAQSVSESGQPATLFTIPDMPEN